MPKGKGGSTANRPAVDDQATAASSRTSASKEAGQSAIPLPDQPQASLQPPFISLGGDVLFTGSHITNTQNARTFLNTLRNHYRLNSAYYSSPDDQRRVLEARSAMSGSAASWFDDKYAPDPDSLSTWSAFAAEFSRIFLGHDIHQVSDDMFTHLRQLKCKSLHPDEFSDFVDEFNIRIGRCGEVAEIIWVFEFLYFLPDDLTSRLHEVRQYRFGNIQWPELAICQQTAAMLANQMYYGLPSSELTRISDASPEFYHEALPVLQPTVPPLPLGQDPIQTIAPAIAAESARPHAPAEKTVRPQDTAKARAICRYCKSPEHVIQDYAKLRRVKALKEERDRVYDAQY